MSHRDTVLATPDPLQVRAETERLAKHSAAAAAAAQAYKSSGGGNMGMDDDDDMEATGGAANAAAEEQEDEHVKEAKRNTFEFTDNIAMNRLMRMFLFLEILGVIVDHPKLRTPPLFNLLCMPGLYYSIRFYAQPFLDAVFVLQTFLSTIVTFWNTNIGVLFSSDATVDTSGMSPFRRALAAAYGDDNVMRYALICLSVT